VLSAVYNLPTAAGSICGVLAAAIISSKTKEAKWVAVGGVVCLALGGGLFAIIRPGINFAAWFFPSLLVGGGIGSLGVIIPVISTLCTPNRYIATAVALGASVRGLGGAVGVVIFTQIFSSKLAEILPETVAAAVVAAGLPSSSVPDLIKASAAHDEELLRQIPDVTREVIMALEHATADSYARSFRFIWYSLIPFAFVTLIMSSMLKTTRDQMSLQVASRVKRHYAHKLKGGKQKTLDG
ncbi:MFS general substrate transporter, partial [Fusarium albosuccineum]